MRPSVHLRAESLVNRSMDCFKNIKDHRTQNVQIPLHDAIMSAYAVFSLKFPSLLQFEKQSNHPARKENLKSMFKIKNIPSDTQMREILDPVSTDEFRGVFKSIFERIQRSKKLSAFEFTNRGDSAGNHPLHYLLAIDGTGFFNSDKVHCESCLTKKSKKSGVKYSHQMLMGALVHPNLKTVIPFAPEPIVRQDGHSKNDCEYNATKRLLKKIKKDHPRLGLVITGDGLYGKGAMIDEISSHGYSYLLSVKPGDHKSLYRFLEGSEQRGHVHNVKYEEVIGEKVKKKVTHKFRYKENIPLHQGSELISSTHFVEYWETTEWEGKKGPVKEEKHFSWVTNLKIRGKENLMKIMRGGRSRWSIENETFNTLKNQGYRFEHNFGHGKKNLSNNFATLMTLAFYIDQVQEMNCEMFQRALKLLGSKKKLWEDMRSCFCHFLIDSWDDLVKYLGRKRSTTTPRLNTS